MRLILHVMLTEKTLPTADSKASTSLLRSFVQRGCTQMRVAGDMHKTIASRLKERNRRSKISVTLHT